MRKHLEAKVNNDLINGFAREIHSRAEQLIETEIWCNDTVFVSRLLTLNFDNQFEFENIENLYDGSNEAIEEFLMAEGAMPKNWEELSAYEQELAAEEAGFSPVIKDVYEWWRVSNHLAERLSRSGQPVLRNDFGAWWGRCCTGQAIGMDGVIQDLVEKRCGYR